MIPSWDDYFLSMLDLVKTRSSDSQTQVACILTEENRQISCGYNGWPSKIDNLPDVRPEKYKFMIHSEINAIVNCPYRPKNPICYVTGIPCNVCSKALWNFGVRRIVSKELPIHCVCDDDYEVLGTLIANGLQFDVPKKVYIDKTYLEDYVDTWREMHYLKEWELVNRMKELLK